MKLRVPVALAALVLSATWGYAQGTQTGVLTGTVTSTDGATLPGATVTARSTALVGPRSTVSDTNGAYILRGLPPGAYKLSFEISGFQTFQKDANVTIGESQTVNASLSVSGLEETVTVTADAASAIVESTSGGETLVYKKVDQLATGRRLVDIADLAPGLTTNTPNTGQLTISGSFAYDNVFLLDGVDINDNLFGTANNTYIEDAIDQVQVLTSGISAEYGRFSGGIINTLTKSGTNEYQGSFRTDLSNPSWTKRTPFEVENDIDRKSALSKIYSATLRGPIIKDKLTFALAGRKQNTSEQNTFDFTGLPHTDTNDNKRLEAKLTASPNQNHHLSGQYTLNNTTDVSPTFDFSIDPRTVNESYTPNHLFVGTYQGTLSSNFFVEAQYSQQKLIFQEGGGSSLNREDSPFFTFNGDHYNAPYFGFNVDPETRSNRQLTASASYFLTTEGLGRHDIKGGFENFRTTGIGGNTQSSTGFVYYADYITGPSGDLVPVWEPGTNLFLNWIAAPGARLDLTTNSFFLNDKVSAGSHWTFNAGVRYERVRSEATGGILGVDTDTIVPRLGAAFDVKGNGALVLKGSYARYAGKYSGAQFGNNTRVGNPSLVYGFYVGPAGTGRDFAPGLDTNNYVFLNAQLPDANVSFEPNLSSPVTNEWAFGVAGNFGGNKGFGQLLYSTRNVTKFVEDFTTLDNGTIDTTIPTQCIGCDGTITLPVRVFRNSDLPERKYQALQAQFGYHFTTDWSFEANWTHQFKNEGNFAGEGANTPGISSTLGDYPEIFSPERNFPIGNLTGYQKDKISAFTYYNLHLGKVGQLSAGVSYFYDSPLSYSLTLENFSLSDEQIARGAAYAALPGTQTLYFGGRGENFFAASHIFGLALTYDVPIYKRLSPYVKFDVRNLFNNQTLGAGINGFDKRILPDTAGPVDELGLPTQFIRRSTFGQATGNNSYPIARTIRFSLGFRF